MSVIVFLARLIALYGLGYAASRAYCSSAAQIRYGKRLGIGWFDQTRDFITGKPEPSTAMEVTGWFAWALALALATLLFTPEIHWWQATPIAIGYGIGYFSY